MLDNSRDHPLFAGRAALLRRIELSLRSGLNCLLTGDPGSGKTSLVRALMYRSHDATDGLRFSYVRGASAHTAADLLAAILTAIRLRPAASPNTTGDPIELITALVDAFADSGDGLPPQVLVVEDVQPGAGLELFGALRDELWKVDARWLVTASTAHAAGLLRPPADVFFETRVSLPRLAADEVADLLRVRFDAPDDAAHDAAAEALVAAVAQADPGTPRRALEMARELLAEPTVGGTGLTGSQAVRVTEGSRRRAAALEQVSRPARMLAAELDSIGWASASDQQLLDRVGWTRPRVVQVVGELERRGLVQMREENTGRGRPRKLYRLTPAAEFIAGTEPAGGMAPDGGTGSSGVQRHE